MENTRPAVGDGITGPGFAAFVSVQDLAFACGQNAGLARELTQTLQDSVAVAAARFGGRSPGFGGDGFLLFFSGIESAVLCLSSLVREWEGPRGEYAGRYLSGGAVLPGWRFLALNTGLSFGDCCRLAVKDGVHYSGPAIGAARRCAYAAKHHSRLNNMEGLNSPDHIFIDSAVRDRLPPDGFTVFGPLPLPDDCARYGDAGWSICAVWPVENAGLAAEPGGEDAARPARLLLASAANKEGTRLLTLAFSTSGKKRSCLLAESVAAYREALRIYKAEASLKELANVQHNLGKTLMPLASTLNGAERLKILEESVATQRLALQFFTAAEYPYDHASTHNSIGNALKDLAVQLHGEEKRGKVVQAVAAYREALKIYTLEAYPADYAMVQNNLGIAFNRETESLSGREMVLKMAEVEGAYREALRVYTAKSDIERYSGTQINLAEALLKQARLLTGEVRAGKFLAAIGSAREALRGYTREKFPNYRAISLRILGDALRDATQSVPAEQKAAMLDEAVSSFEEALAIHGSDNAPNYSAVAQTSLADTLVLQAGLLAGLERAQKMNRAVQNYKEALSIHTKEDYPDYYAEKTAKVLELNALTEQVDKEAAVGRIAAQVAHDIRSPLAALDAALKHVDSLPQERRAMLRNAVDRIRDIADNLLDRNRPPRAGDACPSPQVLGVSLLSLVEPVVAEKRLQYGVSGGEIVFEPAADCVSAAVQPAEFRRLLSNLINNAVEALEKNGQVSVSISSEGGNAVVKISDNGKGIPQKILARLGKKGATFGKEGGSGLGLYHAKTTVEGWGGRLEIASQPGKGTTVSLLLPPAPAPAPGAGLAVLIDDDPLVRMNWKTAAREEGVDLRTFVSSEDFYSAAPDLPKGTPIYIDSELGGGLRGEVLAQSLKEKGYSELCLETGHPASNFSHLPWLKVIGKEPPWERSR